MSLSNNLFSILGENVSDLIPSNDPITRSMIRRNKNTAQLLYLKEKGIETCRRKINKNYIQKSFDTFKYGYLYKYKSRSVVGFILWNEYEKIQKSVDTPDIKLIKILLICADEGYNLGQQMLQDLDRYASKNNFKKIELEAIKDDKLIKFYTINGYTLTTINSDELLMSKPVNPMNNLIPFEGKSYTRKRQHSPHNFSLRRKTRKSKTGKHTMDEEFENTEFHLENEISAYNT
jgi:hypothetical protein